MAETGFDERPPVLVTGGSGFVGSHLVERLVAEGYRVRCLVRRTSSRAWLPTGQGELVYGELAENAGLREAVAGVGLVFHVAGVTKALRPSDYYRGNVQATAHLVRALEESGHTAVRFVHVSSLAAAGPSPDGAPVTEEAPPRPLTHYGRSKLEAERILDGSPLRPNAIVVRPAVVYGPRDTDVLKLFQAAGRGWLFRAGPRHASVSVVHVHDVVEALLAAGRSSRGEARAYFIANPGPVSWEEFAQTIGDALGRRVRVVPVPRPLAWTAGLAAEMVSRLRGQPSILSREKIREAQCRHWACSTVRAQHELGFTAKKTLREGVSETLDWYRIMEWLKW
jgi:nucleoside-diphosphate-sugar epimerase